MSAHLLYQDFLRFLEALSASGEDPWLLYQRHYLGKHGLRSGRGGTSAWVCRKIAGQTGSGASDHRSTAC